MANQRRIKIQKWQEELFKPHRYKIIYGGRGSGKSYGVADALLLISCREKTLVLCGREFQNSIKDSVHSLITQRIDALELSEYFKITRDEIHNIATGSKFIFKGLSFNIDSIKSVSGLTHVWIEEADTLRANSWTVMKPTIRDNDSEIWVTMNPKNREDILYREFIACEELPEETYRVKVNWQHNPHFPKVLVGEMARDKARDHGLYRHIWEGECLEHSDAQIFKDKWDVAEFEEPAGVHKYFGLDFGFSRDPTAGIRCYVHDNRLYITHEAVKIGLEIDKTMEFLEQELPDLRTHTIYADNARPESISFMKRQGLSIKAVEKGKGSVEDGIEYIKSFDRIIINERCTQTIKEFLSYSYKEDARSGDITNDIIDANNHIIDGLRYSLERCMKRKDIDYRTWDMEALGNLYNN